MGNRWHLWDSAARKPDNLPSVFPDGDGGTQCKMDITCQGGGPGTLLPLQHPNNWFWSLLPSVLNLFFHILSLASYFSRYSCRAAKGGMVRVLSWDIVRMGTNPSGWAAPRSHLPMSEQERWSQGGRLGPWLSLVHNSFFSPLQQKARVQVPTHINQKHSTALNKIQVPAFPEMALLSICGRLKLSVQRTL